MHKIFKNSLELLKICEKTFNVLHYQLISFLEILIRVIKYYQETPVSSSRKVSSYFPHQGPWYFLVNIS